MRRIVLALIFPLLLCACVESRRDFAKRMETVSLDAVQVEDDFWTPYYYIHKDVTLPLCVRWTENHFDSTSVSKAVEGMAYSLMCPVSVILTLPRSIRSSHRISAKRKNW